ncbi:MAG: HAMP domain-containing sensor histidine kinase [Caulobacteraceae bacterium]
MRLPPLFRTTPFRLTLMFVAAFALAAAAFLFYIYAVTAGEVTRKADQEISAEVHSLQTVYRQGGVNGLNQAIIERMADGRPYLYLLTDKAGHRITGSIAADPLEDSDQDTAWTQFRLTETDPSGAEVRQAARGEQIRLPTGERLFVGADIGEAESFVVKIAHALWGAGVLMVLLGLLGGLFVSRNVSRAMAGLNAVVAAVQAGDLRARAPVRGARDEFDELASGLNDMLDRLERSMAGIRHAGDAIAHDLRSPLTRLRARLEVALIDVEAGRGDPHAALVQALEDADGVLRTFSAVLAIARLQAAGQAADQAIFDAGDLAAGVAELYEPVCEEKGLEFKAELTPQLLARGAREFVAQALANLLDNAVKYTPEGGAVVLRVRRRSSGEIEFSVTDTGMGVPESDRARIIQRFVRLENSRSQPGAGLGLSLVAAVAEAHGGRLEIDEGPGSLGETGPGLRVALVLPRAG